MPRIVRIAFVVVILAACVPPPTSGAPTLPVLTPELTATASPSPSSPTLSPSATPQPATSTPSPSIQTGPVVIISIDGLRGDALLQAFVPNLMGLAEQGAYTFTAQTDFPPATLPAHASMLTGYSSDRHSVTWNYDDIRRTLPVPTIFSVANEAGLQTAMIVGKQKMHLFALPGAVDSYVYALAGDRDVTDRALDVIAQGFDLLFIHLPNTDYFGHLTGWMSETYIAELTDTDAQVGRILEALPEETTVIVTSDHGGTGNSHGSNIPEHMTIPWIIAGPAVLHNHQLATPVVVTDTAATAAFVLGLPIPHDAYGRPVYEAFGVTPPDLAQGEWLPAALQSPARSEMPAVELNGRVHVPGGFGGESVFQAYDPEADQWIDLAPLPAGRHHLMAAALNGMVYAIGGSEKDGWTPTDTLFAYDVAADRWTELAPMPETRMSGAAVAFNSKVYVLGGVGGTQAILEYDPLLNHWRTLAAMTQPREHFNAAVLDGEIYAIGGRWAGIGELLTVEIYKPLTDEWRAVPDLLRPHSGFAATVYNGHILVAGGEIIMNGNETLTAVELFDPHTGQWSFITDLPAPLHGVPAVVVGNQVYVLGGSSRAGAVENPGTVFVYAP